MLTKQEEAAIANKLLLSKGNLDLISEARPMALLLGIRSHELHALLEALAYKKDHGGLTAVERKVLNEVCRDYDMLCNQHIPHRTDEIHPNTVKWLKDRIHLLPPATRSWLKRRGLELEKES